MAKKDPFGGVENPLKKKLIGEVSQPVKEQQVTEQAIPKSENIQPDLTQSRIVEKEIFKVKRTLFSEMEMEGNDSFIKEIGRITGAKTITWSNINRAMWGLLRKSQDSIPATKRVAPQLSRPSNGNPIAVAQFEEDLADYLLSILKETQRT